MYQYLLVNIFLDLSVSVGVTDTLQVLNTIYGLEILRHSVRKTVGFQRFFSHLMGEFIF